MDHLSAPPKPFCCLDKHHPTAVWTSTTLLLSGQAYLTSSATGLPCHATLMSPTLCVRVTTAARTAYHGSDAGADWAMSMRRPSLASRKLVLSFPGKLVRALTPSHSCPFCQLMAYLPSSRPLQGYRPQATASHARDARQAPSAKSPTWTLPAGVGDDLGHGRSTEGCCGRACLGSYDPALVPEAPIGLIKKDHQ